MTDAKMSIVESSSEAQTLIEPVSQPVALLSRMRKAAAAMESRAAEFFRRASRSMRASASASGAFVAGVADIKNKARADSTKSVAERVRVLRHFTHHARARAQGHGDHAAEDEDPGDRSERAVAPEHVLRDGYIGAVGDCVGDEQDVAERLVAREVCAERVYEVDDARGRDERADGRARREPLVAEERADGERRDGDGRAQERGVDDRGEREPFDEEELVEDY